MEEKERFELFGEHCIKDNNPDARCQLLDAYKACVTLNEQDKENHQLKQQLAEKEKTVQSHEKTVEQKEIKKWKVYYDEESWKDSRFYTTDIYLGLAIQYLKKRSKIGEIIGCTGVAGVFGSLFGCIGVNSFGSVYNIVLACIAGVSIILGVLGLCISLPADSKWSDLIGIYENSKEYEDIYTEIAKEQKEQQDKINAQKAKDLVEAYDILDNKEKTQEERIDLIKKYIK